MGQKHCDYSVCIYTKDLAYKIEPHLLFRSGGKLYAALIYILLDLIQGI